MAADKYSNNNSLPEDEFSLESILAEFKGDSYIAGDKKTPSDVLDDKVDSIIREVLGRSTEETVSKPKSSEDDEFESFFAGLKAGMEPECGEKTEPKESSAVMPSESESEESSAVMPSEPELEENSQSLEEEPEAPETDLLEENEEKLVPEREDIPEKGVSDDELDFFDTFRLERKRRQEAEVRSSVNKGESDYADSLQDEDFEDFDDAPRGIFGGLFAGLGRRKMSDGKLFEGEDDFDGEDDIDEFAEEFAEEPDLAAEADRFGKRLNYVFFKNAGALVLAILMAIITLLFEAGKNIPFGIGTDAATASGVLVIMMGIVMLLGIDVIVRGVLDMFRADISTETLVALSCIMSAAEGIITIAKGSVIGGLPFCVVSAFSLFYAMRGRKLYNVAMHSSLKTAVSSASPYRVISEYGKIEDRAILKKLPNSTKGFYRELVQADVCENVYRIAAPIFMFAALVFAVIATFAKGEPENFTYVFSGLLAVTASFSAFEAFPLPFEMIAKQARRSGCAVAGWAGACDIYESDGALITDKDIFPIGTVSINGIKLFGNADQTKAVQYASSLILASESGLSKIFSELLRSQGLHAARVDDFSCYESGGIGATIDGDAVLVGSAGFMNLMGIRVPGVEQTKHAVLLAVNNQLYGLFSVNYIPANSVQAALISMFKTKVSMLLAARDFNITPMMLQQKFKANMDGVEYIPIADCYRISEAEATEDCDAAGVLCREGLGPFAEVITCGRQLKVVSTVMTAIAVAGSAIAMLLMFYLFFLGAFDSASAGSVLKYMFALHAAMLVMTVFTKKTV